MADGTPEIEPPVIVSLEDRNFDISEKDNAILALHIERQKRFLAEAQLAKFQSDQLLAASNQQGRDGHALLARVSGLAPAEIDGRSYHIENGKLTFGGKAKITPVQE